MAEKLTKFLFLALLLLLLRSMFEFCYLDWLLLVVNVSTQKRRKTLSIDLRGQVVGYIFVE